MRPPGIPTARMFQDKESTVLQLFECPLRCGFSDAQRGGRFVHGQVQPTVVAAIIAGCAIPETLSWRPRKGTAMLVISKACMAEVHIDLHFGADLTYPRRPSPNARPAKRRALGSGRPCLAIRRLTVAVRGVGRV